MRADFEELSSYLQKVLPKDCKDYVFELPEELTEDDIPTTIYASKEVIRKTNFSLHRLPIKIDWHKTPSGKISKTKPLVLTVG